MGLIIISIIGMFISFIGFLHNLSKERFGLAIVMMICFFLNFFMLMINIYNEDEKEKMKTPTAKDVYDGKTTLRVIYEDSIPVNTIVVFKKQYRNE